MEKFETVAIMVDGGFYQNRAKLLFGNKSGRKRADELCEYCMRHLNGTTGEENRKTVEKILEDNK